MLQSDTCNAARATKRLLSCMVELAVQRQVGDEEWARMDSAARSTKCTTWLGDCHGHLRNIIMNAMANGATEFLKDILAEDLSEFSSFDRMSADCMDLVRACEKELHDREYSKGKAGEFSATRRKNFPGFPWLPLERTASSRQDIAFNGSAPLYWNRIVMLDFLLPLVSIPGAKIFSKNLSTRL